MEEFVENIKNNLNYEFDFCMETENQNFNLFCFENIKQKENSITNVLLS